MPSVGGKNRGPVISPAFFGRRHLAEKVTQKELGRRRDSVKDDSEKDQHLSGSMTTLFSE